MSPFSTSCPKRGYSEQYEKYGNVLIYYSDCSLHVNYSSGCPNDSHLAMLFLLGDSLLKKLLQKVYSK